MVYREGLLAPRPTPKLEDHPLSAVHDCLFNLFAATLHKGGRSCIRNLRTRHAVVTAPLILHYLTAASTAIPDLCRKEDRIGSMGETKTMPFCSQIRPPALLVSSSSAKKYCHNSTNDVAVLLQQAIHVLCVKFVVYVYSWRICWCGERLRVLAMDAEYSRWFRYRQTRVRRVTVNVCRKLLDGGSSPSVCNSDEEENNMQQQVHNSVLTKQRMSTRTSCTVPLSTTWRTSWKEDMQQYHAERVKYRWNLLFVSDGWNFETDGDTICTEPGSSLVGHL